MPSDDWTQRKVLVTGCTGFLGSHVAKILVGRGATVVGLARHQADHSYLRLFDPADNIHLVCGSVVDHDLLARILDTYAIDTCLHLAAQSLVTEANRSPLASFESNVRGTWTLLEAARRARSVPRVLVASSYSAYEFRTKISYREADALPEVHPYPATKAMAEILAGNYFTTFGLPVAVARFSNIYGGEDLNYDRIIPGTVRSVIFNEPPILRSAGTALRDYLYVADAVDATLTLAGALCRSDVTGQAFNFGTDRQVSVLNLVEKIIDISGKHHLEPKVLGKGKPTAEIHSQAISIAKTQRVLGWSARYSLEDGLSETLRWYAAFFAKAAAGSEG